MISVKGEARLKVEGQEEVVFPNNVSDQVLTGLMNKIADQSYQYPDSLVPTRISLQSTSGLGWEFKDISSRSVATSGTLAYIDFYAIGFSPATSANQPVQAYEIQLVSDTDTVATANMMSEEINPNPQIYAYQTVNISYRLILSGGDVTWLERLLAIIQGYPYMNSAQWVADNSQFVEVNFGKLYYGSGLLATSVFQMVVDSNQQQQFRVTVPDDVSFPQLNSSNIPDFIEYYCLGTGGEAQQVWTEAVSQISQFTSGSNLKVPFSISMTK